MIVFSRTLTNSDACFVRWANWMTTIQFWMKSELNDSTPQEKNTPRADGYCYAVGLSGLVQNTCENFVGAPLTPKFNVDGRNNFLGVDVRHKKKTFLFVNTCACFSQRWNWGERGMSLSLNEAQWIRNSSSGQSSNIRRHTTFKGSVFFLRGGILNSPSIRNSILQSDSPSEQSTSRVSICSRSLKGQTSKQNQLAI